MNTGSTLATAFRSAWNGQTRLILLVAGGLLVLQGSQAFDATKVLYLVLVAAITVSSMIEVARHRQEATATTAMPLLVASVALGTLVVVSLPVAIAHGTSWTNWLRDGATYALFAAAPFVGVDAARRSSPRVLVALLLVAGVISTGSFAVDWLQLRNIVQLGVTRHLYPSGLMGAALVTYASARSMSEGTHRWRWAVLAGVVFGLFLITGTRTSLVMAVGPLSIALLTGRARAIASARMLAASAASATLVLALFVGVLVLAQTRAEPAASPSASAVAVTSATPVGSPGSAVATPTVAPTAPTSTPAETPRPDILVQHLGSAFTGLSAPGTESSLQDRIAQTAAAWGVFIANPILGTGPGHIVHWVNYLGASRASYVLDTPLVFLSAFGILGLLVLLGWIASYAELARRLGRPDPRSVPWLTWVGFGVVMFFGSVLTLAAEDKGSAFAIAILLALGLASMPTTAGTTADNP